MYAGRAVKGEIISIENIPELLNFMNLHSREIIDGRSVEEELKGKLRLSLKWYTEFVSP